MTIKKEMSTQERYNVIIKNLHEAGMTDNEIEELFNDIREDLRKDGNVSMTMDERIKKFCAFDKWAAKCTALVLPCGLKKSLFIHIKDYIRDTEFENSQVISNEHQQIEGESTQEIIITPQANEKIVCITMEGDKLLKAVKEFMGLLIKGKSSKGMIITDKGNINVQLKKKGKYYKKMIVEYNSQKKECDFDIKTDLLSIKNLNHTLKEFGF